MNRFILYLKVLYTFILPLKIIINIIDSIIMSVHKLIIIFIINKVRSQNKAFDIVVLRESNSRN